MKTQSTKIERRIRLAGILLIAGLLVELVTLRWSLTRRRFSSFSCSGAR